MWGKVQVQDLLEKEVTQNTIKIVIKDNYKL